MAPPDLTTLRHGIRKRAFANLLVVLLEQVRRAAGRLAVLPFTPEALVLCYRDVRTLVRRGDAFALESRDFAVIVHAPPLWPFDRAAALQALVRAPDDYAAPNSDGRGICIDLAGVRPERLPALIFDTLRIARYRLDDVVDRRAADFVRSRPEMFPADTRPLYEEAP